MDRILSVKPIKPHIMLWLTALIGDLKPIKELKSSGVVFESSEALKGIVYDGSNTFLPIHLAVQLGRGNVLHGLDEIHSAVPADILEPVSRKKVLEFAEQEKFYDTAYELFCSGFTNPDDTKAQVRLLNFSSAYQHRKPVELFKIPEEKKSFVMTSTALSENFSIACKRLKAGTIEDPKLSTLLREKKYVEAAQYIVRTLTPIRMPDERACAFLRGFARHHFPGVLVAKINSKNASTNKLLEKCLPRVLEEKKIDTNELDVIQVADVLSDEIAKIKIPLTEEIILGLIQKSINKGLEVSLPAEMKPLIEGGLWEVIALDLKKLTIDQQQQLLSYLELKYAGPDKTLKIFTDLILALKKEITLGTSETPVEMRSLGSDSLRSSGLFASGSMTGSGINQTNKTPIKTFSSHR